MPMTAAEILEAAHQLAMEDQQWLLHSLLAEEEAAWRKETGEPESGYNQWLAERVQKSLADTGPRIANDEAMLRARKAILKTTGMKQSA